MQWIILSLCSALFLGFYDVAKKAAVRDNAVPPVLLLNVMTGACCWLFLLAIGYWYPERVEGSLFYVPSLPWQTHGLLFCKSMLAGSSWIFAFMGLKHLPLSIASPIRATSPVWTALVAVLLFAERPSPAQWAGVAIILLAFFAFSRVGKADGIQFHRDRWVGCMIVATLLGAASAVYDKYLLQNAGLAPASVQAWFSIYLVVVMTPFAAKWFFYDRRNMPFQFRWAIPAIALTLLVADFLYFSALSDPSALISIVSPLRRTSILIPFAVGIIWLSEKNWRAKAACVFAILMGVFLISSNN